LTERGEKFYLTLFAFRFLIQILPNSNPEKSQVAPSIEHNAGAK
jgi:hypothetical protein